uniref:Nuclear envelope integral membrane protein 1 n=1 Tax=Caenorhabditis tropicalis TaxID=1561998 RepID=A0A1I7UK07_9PELO
MQLLTLLLLVSGSFAYNFEDCPHSPPPLSQITRLSSKIYAYNLDFFYYKALPYNAIHAFTDVFLHINLTDTDQYQFYQGANCSAVERLYDSNNRYFGLLRNAALLRSHQLSPFNDTIVGVSTTEPYEISAVYWKVNYIRVAIYLGGIVLFLLASKLVRNVVFYYTSGCSLGILASLLLVAFIVWRVAPKKTIGLPILIGGWSVSIYMLHFAWNNLQSILIEYQKYVIGYFAAVLLISMAVCYKRGPPTDARSHDIAQWTLQLLALTLIYFSVQVVEVSTGTIGALIIQQLFRGFLYSGVRWYLVGLSTFWRKLFPETRRLLNEEEYDEIGQKTTKEQLAQLRDYCRQESNHPWKIAGNVRSARRNRLARFVEGEDDHVTDDEIYAHELTGDVLEDYTDYEDYNDDSGGHYDNPEIRGLPDSRYFTVRGERDDFENWDEVLIKRKSSNFGRDSVHSVRVPRSVSSQLLTPFDIRLNRSLGHNGIGFRRDLSRQNGTAQSEHRPRVPRTEQISRNRRVEYDALRGTVNQSSSFATSSSSVMSPSEYMRRARRIDGSSKTPTRRPRASENPDLEDLED